MKPSDASTRRLLPLALPLLLAACGGGGSGGSSPAVASEQTGTIEGLVVDGLSFETPTLSGVTSDGGRFRYMEGERVRFFLGATSLGEVDGAPSTSLAEIAGAGMPRTNEKIRTALAEDRAYRRLVNGASLLIALDDNGSTADGITIAEPVPLMLDALFAEQQIDLDRDPREFDHERTFRIALAEAKALGLVPEDARPRPVPRVLETLYTASGVQDAAYAQQVVETYGVHGQTWSPSQTMRRTLEAHGIIREEWGPDPWSEPFLTRVRAFDGYGRLVEDWNGNERRMHDDDGDLVATWSYQGLTQYFDNDVRGLPLHSYRVTSGGMELPLFNRSYDELGRVLVDTNLQTGEVRTHEYEPGIERLEVRGESTAEAQTFRFDELGREVAWSRDLGANGSIDATRTTEYDADGNRILLSRDHDGDSYPEYEETSTFDGAGNEIERQIRHLDSFGISLSSQAEFWHDDRGNVTTLVVRSSGLDLYRAEFAYDEHDNVVQILVDHGADDLVDERVDITWMPGAWDLVLEEETASGMVERHVDDGLPLW